MKKISVAENVIFYFCVLTLYVACLVVTLCLCWCDRRAARHKHTATLNTPYPTSRTQVGRLRGYGSYSRLSPLLRKLVLKLFLMMHCCLFIYFALFTEIILIDSQCKCISGIEQSHQNQQNSCFILTVFL